MTDWTIIRRSMRARLFSTVTTVVSVAVAVALMTVLIVMQGAGRRAFERGAGNMHLLVSRDADPLTTLLNGVFYARPPRNYLTWAKYEELAADPRVSGEPGPGLEPGFAVPIQVGDSYRGSPVLATTGAFFGRFKPQPESGWEFAAGRAFTGDFQCVLGASAARRAGLAIGDRIVLTHGTPGSGVAGRRPHEHTQFKYEVVGILRPTGSAHDRAVFTNLESAWIIHAHDRIEREEAAAGGHEEHDEEHGAPTTAADLKEEDRKITGVYLRLVTRQGSDTPAGLPQYFDQLRRDTSLTVAQPGQEIDRLFAIVSNIDQLLVGMAVVVMVSSGIAIMLALYNSMEQRRRQVAVLRVLGASRGRIFGLVVTESALIGVLGAAAGVGLCLIGVRIVAAVMRERLGLVIDTGLPAREVVGVVLGAILLAAIAGIVPAAAAYRTSVARNLRPLG